MKRILILVILATTSIYTNGQNFVFIGENSFHSTETFTLPSNSDNHFINDLNLIFAKDGTKGLLVVSSKLVSTVLIRGKLIIYLNDGTVITCIDKGLNENVDDIAKSVYYLTNEELEKMKKSNIHTVRYELKCSECLFPIYEGNHSASNKGRSQIDFTTIIREFFK